MNLQSNTSIAYKYCTDEKETPSIKICKMEQSPKLTNTILFCRFHAITRETKPPW